jgi:hypothetical protein
MSSFFAAECENIWTRNSHSKRQRDTGLHRWDRSARYALIVSIRAQDTEVDLYTAIANRIGVEIPAS